MTAEAAAAPSGASWRDVLLLVLQLAKGVVGTEHPPASAESWSGVDVTDVSLGISLGVS